MNKEKTHGLLFTVMELCPTW